MSTMQTLFAIYDKIADITPKALVSDLHSNEVFHTDESPLVKSVRFCLLCVQLTNPHSQWRNGAGGVASHCTSP